MRIYVLATTALLILLASVPAQADFVCTYVITYTITDFGPVPIDVQMTCTEIITVTGGGSGGGGGCCSGGGGDGGGTPIDPPKPFAPLPSVSITSISDENPHQPKLTVAYNESVARLTLDVGWAPQSTLYPPNAVFFLPSLDNLTSSQTQVRVTAYDSAGNSASATAHVNRSTQTITGQNDFLLQYWVSVGQEITDRVAHYYHGTAGQILYADYDIPTDGARNGRVQHVTAENALFWNNGQIMFGTSATPYPSVFVASYSIHAATYSGAEVAYHSSSCDPSGFTRQMYPYYAYPGAAGQCATVVEFSAAASPGGTASIDYLDAGNLMWSVPQVIPPEARQIVISP